jgi:hypothetical protein
MWEVAKDLVPGEKYKIVHFENYQFIFPWNREYHGRFTHIEYRQFYFDVIYCYDYVVEEEIPVKLNMAFNPCVKVYKMARTGQSSMEHRSYEMVMQGLICGMIAPSFL